MGKLLKGIRSNLLNNKKNSFNIGFSNRSPFSYQLPSVDPNSGITPVQPPDMDNFGVEAIQAQSEAAVAATKAFGETASAAITEAKKQYSDKDIAEEKLERKQKKIDNKKRRNYAKTKGIKPKDVDQKDVDAWDPQTDTDVSKSKKKRYKKLGDQVTKLDADIQAGEYSDVSGADLEKAADEKQLAVDQASTADAKKILKDAKDACAKAGGNWVNGKCDK